MFLLGVAAAAVVPQVISPIVPSTTLEKPKESDQFEWVTIEQSGELVYEAPETIAAEPPPPPINKQQLQGQASSSSSSSVQTMSPIPAHSLAAFGLFLRLHGYAEVLLKERKHAQCLLRLVLGVTDDGEGSKCSGTLGDLDPGPCVGSWLPPTGARSGGEGLPGGLLLSRSPV